MTAFVAILLAPFAVLTLFFIVELMAGLARGRPGAVAASSASAVIVIPAHNEELCIEETIRSLQLALDERMRILVIADNCRDSTAELARASGVQVVERSDTERRGKGFALDHAAELLRSDPPDVIVILDADCQTDSASLKSLIDSAYRHGPKQGVYLLRPDLKASPLTQLSCFAFLIKNLVRQRGLQRLAGRVHLTGSGMAMPFGMFVTSATTRSSIVEDLVMGLELSERGHPPTLAKDAYIWSSSSNVQAMLTQRQRWEGGFIATSLRWVPRMAYEGLRRASWPTMLSALDLIIPPLSLFGILNLAALILAALLVAVSNAGWWPVAAQLTLVATASAVLLMAWWREGRQFISLTALAQLPFYVLWKLPMYFGLARGGGPKEWIRTER